LGYKSYQKHVSLQNGKEMTMIKEVKIKNGKGTKRVTLRNSSGKLINSKSIPLNSDETRHILSNTFIPGLFTPCIEHCNSTVNAKVNRAKKSKITHKRNNRK
jgi:hypothetical protein